MVQAAEALDRRDLFGGMASIACPARLQDISNVRPVPDHQEVLTDAALDQSLIIEVLVCVNLMLATIRKHHLLIKYSLEVGHKACSSEEPSLRL
jgi:Ran-interacting Mog1 protein